MIAQSLPRICVPSVDPDWAVKTEKRLNDFGNQLLWMIDIDPEVASERALALGIATEAVRKYSAVRLPVPELHGFDWDDVTSLGACFCLAWQSSPSILPRKRLRLYFSATAEYRKLMNDVSIERFVHPLADVLPSRDCETVSWASPCIGWALEWFAKSDDVELGSLISCA